jgi:membrane protease YdiL (CAAX protease family)
MILKYITYAIFILAILSLWLPVKSKIKPWTVLLGLSIVLAFISHIVNIIGIGFIILFYLLVNIYYKAEFKLKIILWLPIFLIALAFETHNIPGFKNLLIWHKIQFTPDAIPFTLYWNFDKTMVGVIILGVTLNLAHSLQSWKDLLPKVIIRLPLVIFIILILTLSFGYSKFEPKLPHNLWLWVISNLLFTCVAEEGLFRGFFQQTLQQLKFCYSSYVAILIPAITFGLMHYAGGIKYIILASVAGVLYGWVYKVTQRIEASILTHFLLNLTHILLFTYPALLK